MIQNFEPDTEVNVTDRPAHTSQGADSHPSLQNNQGMRPGAIMSQADELEMELDTLVVQNRPVQSENPDRVVSVADVDVDVEILSESEGLHQRPNFEDRSMLLGKGELLSEKNNDHEIAPSTKPMDDLFKGL